MRYPLGGQDAAERAARDDRPNQESFAHHSRRQGGEQRKRDWRKDR